MLPNAASVALVRKNDLLLIQRARAPMEGLWTLPGGRMEPGETLEQCAQREIKEELGLYAFALRPVRQLQVKQYRLQVFATQGFEGEIVWDTSKPNGQPRRKLDTSRAKELFGFEARTPFREGIARTVAWYREHASAYAGR